MDIDRVPADPTEEPRFAVEGVLTEELYTRFARAHLKLTGGGRVLLLLSGLLFAVGSFLLVLDLCYSEGGHEVRGTAETLRAARSDVRRVGEECRSRWSPYH